VHGAHRWAMRLHTATVAALAWFGAEGRLGIAYWIGLCGIAFALIHEHRVASRRDVAAINRAFFQVNAIVGVVFVLSILIDVVTR
jgi:4-hydroxybenzoate polyprenyltransferase